MTTAGAPKTATRTRSRTGPRTRSDGAPDGQRTAPHAAGPALDPHQLVAALRAFTHGDFSVKLRGDLAGVDGQLAEAFNELVDMVRSIAAEASEVATAVRTEAQAPPRMRCLDASGGWSQYGAAVNEVITVLSGQADQLIRTLAETTRVNQEQDWLKTHVARFTRMLQGQRDLLTVARQILSELAQLVNAQHGAFYLTEAGDAGPILKLFAAYACQERRPVAKTWRFGQGLIGRAALEGRTVVTKVPTEDIQMALDLGEPPPDEIVVVPILFEGEVKGVIELASAEELTGLQLAFLDQMLESLGIVIATIEATMRTDELLRQSQSLTEELRSQQDELQQTNEELEEKAVQLSVQKAEVEKKNKQVELARQELEEKAEQLALASKYKSQFLANMSHELRTPLNSLLILSRQLADNLEGNLTDKQIRYADTIRQAGCDLMTLINEILDLAKIESGTMAIEVGQVGFGNLRDYVDQTFRQVAEERGLGFAVELDASLPPAFDTDDMRLRQVLRNLLSNAMKFTERGRVTLRVYRAAPSIVGFAVSDTGIGIARDKQRLIFEAFQQADGSTSRKYGGTGLGLAISREIAGLLAGDLRVDSTPGTGSTFTLLLPLEHTDQVRDRRDRTQRRARTAPVPALAAAPPPERLETASSPAPRTHPGPDAGAPGHAEATLASHTRVVPRRLATFDPLLAERTVLVVDDDVRNIFALTSLLEGHKLQVQYATNGRHALARLAENPHIDIVLMDVMMPEMDGYEAVRKIRERPSWKHLPVIAVTAKAMQGDREKCLAAGASDYITKPVDADQLLSLLRVWLDRARPAEPHDDPAQLADR